MIRGASFYREDWRRGDRMEVQDQKNLLPISPPPVLP